MDPANPAKRVAQLLQQRRGTLYQEHLERLVVFQEDVLGGDDFLEVIGLGLGELVAHAAAIAAVNDGDRAREHLVGAGERFVFGQGVTDQFGNQLRARRQAALFDHHVELPEQFAGKAHAEPSQAARFGSHLHSSLNCWRRRVSHRSLRRPAEPRWV
jgi:hypothetical protein